MPTVSAFDKRTLRERCTSHVRAQIINGDIKPGEHVVEARLSEDLGVSRGTLREALRPLENEGLLTDDGRGHLLVRQTSQQEIADVFVVRTVLESLTAALLSQREDRAELAAQLRKALEPLKDPDIAWSDQIDTDLGFHELMCSLTGNEMLLRSWRNLIGHIEMMIVAAGPERAIDRMRYDAHAVIADAIEGGDESEARAVVETHMSGFNSLYLGDLQEVAS